MAVKQKGFADVNHTMPYRPPDGPEKYRDEDWLRREYCEKEQSIREIADKCDCSGETIRRWLERHGIGTRSTSEAVEIAHKKHPQIREASAEALGENRVNSWDYWDEDEREAFRERLSEERQGEGNPMYGVTVHSDGETEYRDIYQTPEWEKARKQVYERDNHTCQLCKDPSSGPLHAHHLTPVSDGGEPYDLSNLMTLCEDCHHRIHYG